MKNLILILFVSTLLWSCGGSSSYQYEKSPVDKIMISKSNLANYSIALSDMDYNQSSDIYKHKYKIVYQPKNNPDTLLIENTGWYNVSPQFFNKHINDLGMALVTVKNHVAERQVSPPGYSNYVGNEKYGRWENRNGTSFWHFYGQYMFMSHMFNLISPVRHSYYNDYRSSRHYGTTYYGPTVNGRSAYGTNSYSRNKTSKWSTKSSTFKQRIRSKVKRSSMRSSSRKSSIFSGRSSSRSSTRRGTFSRRSYGRGFGK